jgi:tRNA-dihydrouridine synthase
VPLVVQLIGHGREALVSAARSAQAAGAAHINLNLGCPYGRMTSGLTGGGMLRRPELLEEIVLGLRAVITGSFSVKLRSGYDDPLQIFDLLPLFESAGVDFLVLHPRTVAQEYRGLADHAITSRVVRQTRLPVIANGDIRTAADGIRLLEESGAAGLMLGRGAIADPLLFERLRGNAPGEPARPERAAMLQRYLEELLARYGGLFCGETQVLNKVKGVLATFDNADFEQAVRQLRKAKTMPAFRARLAELE